MFNPKILCNGRTIRQRGHVVTSTPKKSIHSSMTTVLSSALPFLQGASHSPLKHPVGSLHQGCQRPLLLFFWKKNGSYIRCFITTKPPKKRPGLSVFVVKRIRKSRQHVNPRAPWWFEQVNRNPLQRIKPWERKKNEPNKPRVQIANIAVH